MRRMVMALLLAAALLVSTLAVARADTGVPAPTADPFYRVPRGLRAYPNGAVIASRRITAFTGPLPVAATAWQVKYRTTDTHGRPTATVATVLVPTSAWTGPGRRPLVAYQSAEDGVGLRCTPSYALRAGLAAGATPSAVDLAYGVPLLIGQGWAVVVPDWEGPKSLFGVHAMAGHAVLDAVRAAQRLRPAHLSGRRPLTLWGYSGGGFATTAAAQVQHTYAPRLPLTAIAAGGVPGDIRNVLDTASGGLFGGATILLLISAIRAYPGARLASYADDALRTDMRTSSEDCLADAPVHNPLLDISKHMRPRGYRLFRQLLHDNSPLAISGHPTVPMYLYQAAVDELVPVDTARQLAQRFCDQGVRLDFDLFLGGEHLVEAAVGGLGALSYLSQRFAGVPAPTTC